MKGTKDIFKLLSGESRLVERGGRAGMGRGTSMGDSLIGICIDIFGIRSIYISIVRRQHIFTLPKKAN